MAIKIEITEKQAEIILNALENESSDDMVQFGEYSYWRCYRDIAKKLKRAGFTNEHIEINGIE